MRISSTAKALITCFALVLGACGCGAPSGQQGGGQAAPTIDSLKNHPLFQNANLVLRHQPCMLSIDSSSSDAEHVESYVTQEVHCMDRAWHSVFSGAGITAERPAPDVKFVRENPYPTACGPKPSTDVSTTCQQYFYLQSNNPIFRNRDGSLNIYSAYASIAMTYPWWVSENIGLEALVSAVEKQLGAAQQVDLRKRHLLSLQCISALYFGSQYKDADNDRDFFNYYYDNIGDSLGDPQAAGTDEEPSGQHYIDWFRKGADAAGKPSACNTWAAPASEIS